VALRCPIIPERSRSIKSAFIQNELRSVPSPSEVLRSWRLVLEMPLDNETGRRQ
jgi:hypothetical protein